MRRLLFIAGLAVTGLILLVHILDVQGVRSVEEELYDQYQRLSPRPYDPNAPVRLVDIDQESLNRFGQWPWPRYIMAELTNRLRQAEVGAIGFDIFFEEPDRTSPQTWAASRRRFGAGDGDIDITGLTDNDEEFASALASWPTVLSVAGLPKAQNKIVAFKAQMNVVGDDPTQALVGFAGTTSNVDVLAKAATGLGFISLGDAKSRIVRKVPIAVNSAGVKAPALSMEVLRVAQGETSYTLKATGSQDQASLADPEPVALRVGALIVPVDSQGQLRVRYSGHQTQRIVPAWKVLEGDTAATAELAGRLVVVGTSVPGLFDIIETPLDPRTPGMQVHAEILEQVIAGTYLYRPYWATGAERGLLVLFGLLATLLGMLQRPALTLAGVLVLMSVAAGGSWWVFSTQDMLLAPLFPIAAALAVYVATTGLGIFLKERERRAVRNQFAHFIPPELINTIADDPEHQLTPSGDSRELTVMFIDVRKFSTLTESMSPETVVDFVNDFLTPLSDMILDRGGTIDKFIGDAIMAFWNAPTREPDHAGRAVETLLAMPGVLNDINTSFAPRGLPDINAGAGVNTGPCSVGFMGSRRRLGYTGIGDAVNLASRLEGQTKAYGVMNCIGDSTAQAVAGRFAMVEIDVVAVKGRTQPEPIHTVLGHAPMLQDAAFQSFKSTLAHARAAYTTQQWHRAEDAFNAIGKMSVPTLDTEALARTYLERIGEMIEFPPPPDWDGVHIARTK
ncbi:MAG: adenylate/guanylate cyclase domain-containing protein [Pseudomonadota bacterium]